MFQLIFRIISYIRPAVIKQLQKHTHAGLQKYQHNSLKKTHWCPRLQNPWHCSKCCCMYNSFKIMNMKWVKSTRITLHLMSLYTHQAEQMLPPVPDICCSVSNMSSLFSADLNCSLSRWRHPSVLSANTRGRAESFTDLQFTFLLDHLQS